MSLFLIEGVEDKNVDSPILSLARCVDRVANEFDLLRMAHSADLNWVLGELKGIIAAWGDDEFHQAVTKNRVQHLRTALADRIKEI